MAEKPKSAGSSTAKSSGHRKTSDSSTSMLSQFIYDTIIQDRLLHGKAPSEAQKEEEAKEKLRKVQAIMGGK
ncbi:hypothetical protein AJ80_02323 [Polytolypa hystricis UAMH7299]|uniref:Uncharacterized protein n=1 Tax=Polytolypa hystricis (strain UAMH7299) TaxID=1447883 RepID=A0A2B7YRC6_POLH7|nr:hypothetical protein AJ80_02323 [Polytolypa hystricis UAMH7299]